MIEIKPSQFIEIILEFQKRNSIFLMKLKVRNFNKMVDRLYDLNIRVNFGFSDLVEFVDIFENIIPYKDYAIHISYTEELLNEVKKYNQIYESIMDFVKINDTWKAENLID